MVMSWWVTGHHSAIRCSHDNHDVIGTLPVPRKSCLLMLLRDPNAFTYKVLICHCHMFLPVVSKSSTVSTLSPLFLTTYEKKVSSNDWSMCGKTKEAKTHMGENGCDNRKSINQASTNDAFMGRVQPSSRFVYFVWCIGWVVVGEEERDFNRRHLQS